MFSLRSLLNRQPVLQPEPPIVEDKFVPTITPEPGQDTIVMLAHGSNLLSNQEGATNWSTDGISALRAMLLGLPGNLTVFTCIPRQAVQLAQLDNSQAWTGTSMLIGSVKILNRLDSSLNFTVNPGGPCDVVIATTSYLDAVGQLYRCRAYNPRDPHTSCSHLAFEEILMQRFNLTKREAELVLAGTSLPERYLNVVHRTLSPTEEDTTQPATTAS